MNQKTWALLRSPPKVPAHLEGQQDPFAGFESIRLSFSFSGCWNSLEESSSLGIMIQVGFNIWDSQITRSWYPLAMIFIHWDMVQLLMNPPCKMAHRYQWCHLAYRSNPRCVHHESPFFVMSTKFPSQRDKCTPLVIKHGMLEDPPLRGFSQVSMANAWWHPAVTIIIIIIIIVVIITSSHNPQEEQRITIRNHPKLQQLRITITSVIIICTIPPQEINNNKGKSSNQMVGFSSKLRLTTGAYIPLYFTIFPLHIHHITKKWLAYTIKKYPPSSTYHIVFPNPHHV